MAFSWRVTLFLLIPVFFKQVTGNFIYHVKFTKSSGGLHGKFNCGATSFQTAKQFLF